MIPQRLHTAIALFALATALPISAGAADSRIFELTDPRGDDHGDGTIRYPLNYYDLRPGDLDLVSLAAERVDGGTLFIATFAGAVKKTQRRTIDMGGGNLDDLARHDFYQQNLDIYIDIDRVPGSGGVTTLPGRKAELAADTAWERAVVLTPRPFDARSAIERLLMRQLQAELSGDDATTTADEAKRIKGLIPADVARHIFFPQRITVRGSKISFMVPDSFLGGPAQAGWSYVAFTSGTQVDQRFDFSDTTALARQQSLMILPVAPGGAQERFGGSRDDDYQQPPIIDLIVGPGQSQKQLLSTYDAARKVPVVLPGVVPANPPAPTPAPPALPEDSAEDSADNAKPGDDEI